MEMKDMELGALQERFADVVWANEPVSSGELVKICDVMHIYDNTKEPYRIFKKRKSEYFYWENEFWDKARIEELTGRKL